MRKLKHFGIATYKPYFYLQLEVTVIAHFPNETDFLPQTLPLSPSKREGDEEAPSKSPSQQGPETPSSPAHPAKKGVFRASIRAAVPVTK